MTTVGESPLAKQKHLIVKDVMVPKMIPVGGLVERIWYLISI